MKATIIDFDSAVSLLSYLLSRKHHTARTPTTLIICSTRTDFLSQLTPTLLPVPPDPSSPSHTIQPTPPLHPLLHPTLSNLSLSHQISIAYCPTIDILRSYLCTLGPSPPQPPRNLILLNAISLHYSTSEFSAQGLSRTLSGIISTSTSSSTSSSSSIMLAETPNPLISPPFPTGRIWETQIPLLSGSVRLDASTFPGRTVSVRRVVRRWFKFVAAPELPCALGEQELRGGGGGGGGGLEGTDQDQERKEKENEERREENDEEEEMLI